MASFDQNMSNLAGVFVARSQRCHQCFFVTNITVASLFLVLFLFVVKMKLALLLQAVFGVELVDKARNLFRQVDTDGDRELSAPELAHWLEKSAAHERKLISLEIVSSYLYLQHGQIYFQMNFLSCDNMI